LFVLYYLLFDRNLRHGLNNHVIIVLLIIGLIVEVTDYSWILYWYQYKGVWERSVIFCTIWGFIDWCCYAAQGVLFTWATIERHILIFHDKWVSTKKKRFFVHYLPLIVLLLYCLLFYGVAFFFPPCENGFDVSAVMCISPCLLLFPVISMWEAIVNQILPGITIIVFSIALFVRVLWQKHRIVQQIQWRKHRKMTVQLLSISLLYLIFLFPFTVMHVMSLCGVQSEMFDDFLDCTLFLNFFVFLLFPFVCALSLPELRGKLIKIFYLRRQTRRIGPKILTVRAPVNNRPHAQ